MKIIVLAGGLSPERDVSLISGAGICRTLRARGHRAFLLDVFFGYPCNPEDLEKVFDLPDGGLKIAEGIKTTTPDLEALRLSRPDQSDCYLGPQCSRAVPHGGYYLHGTPRLCGGERQTAGHL